MTQCRSCGTFLAPNSQICNFCGQPVMLEPPRGRGLFSVGAIGALLMAIASLMLGMFHLIVILEGGGLYFYDDYLYYLMIISIILFMTGSILIGIGFFGFTKFYKSAYSYVPMIFGIVSSVLFLLFAYIGVYDSYYGEYYLDVFVWFGHIFVGVSVILTGVGFLLVRKKTGLKGPCIAAGTIFIVAGGMLIGLLGFIGAAWFVLAPAGFVATVIFLKAKLVPPPEPLPQQYGYPGYPQQQYPQQQYPPQEQYPPQQYPPPPGY